jgi:hypothetical protein
MRFTVEKKTAAPLIVPLNPHSGLGFFSMQNETGEALTIEVTNQDVQWDKNVQFHQVPLGDPAVPADQIAAVQTPHAAVKLSGSGTGKVHFVVT